MSDLTVTATPGTSTIEFSRTFTTTPQRLFHANVDDEWQKKWLGPDRLETEIIVNEVRDGGRWRWLQREPDGNEYVFRGVYHGEPSVENGITRTFEFEGMPGHVSLETLRFTDLGDGRTRMDAISAFASVEDRDGMVESGMEGGMEEGFVRLEKLLADS
ncbi:SRPBCC domain-containing protein [Mumia sp. zg.B53]|uniref:SRPBCC domain-containing protein n=1 Tax=unclassified Mumia TaxID=2621872 RepID=UPI001C6E3B23|nr:MULTISPECIES: SRPBCC domain-containing protein [unclassified Mumia]MBW9205396.1 SRPBCC domain-containing protein [Mumia sp. zg.B17]MBW9208603.1 SRPBCC domain-containing protein [Mumia sp. zg.B21]MBW9216561.1 SRPBCC domain-containing protein [Mumia sp. zg.B53]MDD9348313.1 SRPBCC domain-containing protein [Mumia sp.]